MNNISIRKSVLPFNLRPQCIVAISVITIGLSFICYWIVRHYQSPSAADMQARYKNDINPGEDRALLILSGGSIIALVDSINGTLAKDGGNHTPLRKGNGWLYYNRGLAIDSMYNNTLTVPRGGQYRVLLNDGTRVWLNANSTLVFPLRFGTQAREVKLTGEAYFEVAGPGEGSLFTDQVLDTAVRNLPFIVQMDSGSTSVKATSLHPKFNVCAYGDRGGNIVVTSVNANIRLRNATHSVFLRPGQGGTIEGSGKGKLLDSAAIARSMAWKDGLLRFFDTPMEEVLAEIGRWYDVDILCKERIQERYTGILDREAALTQSLRMLEMTTHCRFRLEGNQLTVIR